MARINVNPTRMELTRLKKRLAMAVRGHKLLKDKRDELMRQFLDLVRENAALRERVEAALSAALGEFALCRGLMEAEMLENALLYPARTVELQMGSANIMSVRVPRIEARAGETVLSYGLAQTTAQLDGAIASLAAVFPDMIRLAELEKPAICWRTKSKKPADA